mmetsp:Transcript_48235/g.124480  ORF Transcript_48235/g.124480 Transcript_48235/m.124480 type:complete len:220 (-) Transcript_48235:18-677(-)
MLRKMQLSDIGGCAARALKQPSQCSSWTRSTTVGSGSDAFSRVSTVLPFANSALEDAITSAIFESTYCASFMDPADESSGFKMVSDEFTSMTGFHKDNILGHSARFLVTDCNNDPADLCHIRLARQTGIPTTVVLTNRKADGMLFRQILHIRGLKIANDAMSGDSAWYLIGIHKEISDLTGDVSADAFAEEIEEAAEEILAGVTRHLAEVNGEEPVWLR